MLLTDGLAFKALGQILTAATILLFLSNLRRAGERAGRAADRLDVWERNDARATAVPLLTGGQAAGMMFRFWVKKFFGS